MTTNFSEQEKEIISFGRANGKTPQEIERAVARVRSGYIPTARLETATPTKQAVTGIMKGIGSQVRDAQVLGNTVAGAILPGVTGAQLNADTERANEELTGLTDADLKATTPIEKVSKGLTYLASLLVPTKAPQGVATQLLKGVDDAAAAISPTAKATAGLVERAEDAISAKLLNNYSVGELLNKAIKPSAAGVKKARNTVVELEKLSGIIQPYAAEPIDDIFKLYDASKLARKDIWDKVTTAFKGSDATVPVSSFRKIVDNINANKVQQSINPNEIKQLDELVKRMEENFGDKMPVNAAEEFKEFFNAELKGSFGKTDIGETYKRGLQKMNEYIGNVLNEKLSALPNEFAQLKKDYGILASYSDDIAQRAIVAGRQNPSSLVTSFTRVEGVSNVLSGLLTAQPSMVLKGAGQAVLGKVHSNLNNSDKLIKEAFNRARKISGSTLQAPISQPPL